MPKLCSRCNDRPSRARGLCTRCYKWADYHDVLPARERLTPLEKFAFAKAGRSHEECWPWPGTIKDNGYGLVRVDGILQPAHRWVWKIQIGPIPGGHTLDHLCHNIDDDCPGGPCLHRRCVNYVRHLEPVTRAVNNQRGKAPSAIAARTGVCGRGHKLSKRGNRQVCIVCDNAGQLRRYHERKKHS